MSLTHSTTNKVKQVIKECNKTALKLKGRVVLAPYWGSKNFPIQQFTKTGKPFSPSPPWDTHTHTAQPLTVARKLCKPTSLPPTFIFTWESLFFFLFFLCCTFPKSSSRQISKEGGGGIKVNHDSRSFLSFFFSFFSFPTPSTFP